MYKLLCFRLIKYILESEFAGPMPLSFFDGSLSLKYDNYVNIAGLHEVFAPRFI